MRIYDTYDFANVAESFQVLSDVYSNISCNITPVCLLTYSTAVGLDTQNDWGPGPWTGGDMYKILQW
jgi:hypothetical protein